MAKDKIVLNIIDGYKEGDVLTSTNPFYNALWNSQERALTITVQNDENIDNVINSVELKSQEGGEKFLSVTYETSNTKFDLEEYHATTNLGLQKADTEASVVSQEKEDNINFDNIVESPTEGSNSNLLAENNIENIIPNKEDILENEAGNIALATSNHQEASDLTQQDSFEAIEMDIDNTSFENGFNSISTTTDLSSFFEVAALSIKIKETT